jgi:hypothetical protein
MKKKLIGICICILLITTCVIPVMADTTQKAAYIPFNDAAFDQKISNLLMALLSCSRFKVISC